MEPIRFGQTRRFLWVSTADRIGLLIDRDRLTDLAYRGATPENEAEVLLVQNPEWLHHYIEHVNSAYPMTIPEGRPLPAFRQLRKLGRCGD